MFQPAVVFLYKLQNAQVKFDHHLFRHPSRALSTKMHNLTDRSKSNIPAGLSETIAPVSFFGTHEEIFIQQADLLSNIAPQEHEGPGDSVDFMYPVGIQIGQVIPAKALTLREKSAQADEFKEGHTGCGKAPAAGQLERSIGIENLTPDNPGLGVLGHEGHHSLQGIFLDDGIRVEKQAKYVKIFNNTEGEQLVKRASDYFDSPIVSLVFNFLDILAHGRSNNVILKEIAGTDAAFRSLMKKLQKSKWSDNRDKP